MVIRPKPLKSYVENVGFIWKVNTPNSNGKETHFRDYNIKIKYLFFFSRLTHMLILRNKRMLVAQELCYNRFISIHFCTHPLVETIVWKETFIGKDVDICRYDNEWFSLISLGYRPEVNHPVEGFMPWDIFCSYLWSPKAHAWSEFLPKLEEKKCLFAPRKSTSSSPTVLSMIPPKPNFALTIIISSKLIKTRSMANNQRHQSHQSLFADVSSAGL